MPDGAKQLTVIVFVYFIRRIMRLRCNLFEMHLHVFTNLHTCLLGQFDCVCFRNNWFEISTHRVRYWLLYLLVKKIKIIVKLYIIIRLILLSALWLNRWHEMKKKNRIKGIYFIKKEAFDFKVYALISAVNVKISFEIPCLRYFGRTLAALRCIIITDDLIKRTIRISWIWRWHNSVHSKQTHTST